MRDVKIAEGKAIVGRSLDDTKKLIKDMDSELKKTWIMN